MKQSTLILVFIAVVAAFNISGMAYYGYQKNKQNKEFKDRKECREKRFNYLQNHNS